MPFFPWLAATVWPLVPIIAFGIGYNVGVDEHHAPPPGPPNGLQTAGPPNMSPTNAATGAPAGPPNASPTSMVTSVTTSSPAGPPAVTPTGPPAGVSTGAPAGPPNVLRDTSAQESQLILQINHTALAPQELRRLRGLQMKVASDGHEALFSVPGDFEADGNITGIWDAPSNGLKQGGLSFFIPGLLTPVQGWWATLPQMTADEREDIKEAFETIYETLVSQQPHVPEPWQFPNATERLGLFELIGKVVERLVHVEFNGTQA
ncbi:uncharacterized protein LTR77_009616 [Saxophila tyrrhenica]|uniref:Uncharacterized protein n=1 Tax=Saxophila tyrrhenica TaxID=1690608 RepID=A0AAV9P003_9PEZI|nr:hypothetical protein LTR77_009616 [Saxophila tyrrhenica]